MTQDVPVKCTCGKVTGLIKNAQGGQRVACMCRSCQAYAHHLGRPKDILDQHGATEIVQLTPSQLRLQTGTEELKCLQLTPKGALRWFAGCCNTPIGNTMDNRRAAFVGIPRLFIDLTDQEIDSRINASTQRIHARHGHNDAPGHKKASAGFIVGALGGIVFRSLVGRAQPSPFFDPKTKAPRVTPVRISSEDYASLRERAKQAP